MNIRSVSNFASKLTGLDIRRRIFNYIPNMTVNSEELVGKIGTILSRPDVGRAILGVTAMGTQPFIDYYNPRVDRDTATVSTCRTVGKILAGTTVGCIVRSACYYGSRALTNTNAGAKPWQKFLLPPETMIQYLSKRNPDWIKNYRSSLALIAGLAAMLVTNVVLDVPFTNLISKKLIDKFRSKNAVTPDMGPNYPVNTNPKWEPYDVKEKFRKVFFDEYEHRKTCALPGHRPRGNIGLERRSS